MGPISCDRKPKSKYFLLYIENCPILLVFAFSVYFEVIFMSSTAKDSFILKNVLASCRYVKLSTLKLLTYSKMLWY